MFIKEFIQDNKIPPTRRELADHYNITVKGDYNK